MKKIDLHIHTIPTVSDNLFSFDLNSLKDYVEKLNIDCIAITNHNLFDKGQFEQICRELSIKVFPGIEINLEGGHILLISENEELEDFSLKCQNITSSIRNNEDYITYEQLIGFFPVLGKYLDVIAPMIYKGNYRTGSNWIRATTNWFVKNSGGAKIWGGIQTYHSDNNIEILSVSDLRKDSKAVMQGGAAGIALFRWGLSNFFNFLSIK